MPSTVTKTLWPVDSRCGRELVSLRGRIVSVNVSEGGVPKRAVGGSTITEHGVAGDRQRDLKRHGGPDRAVLLYSLDVIEQLREEGHPIRIGSVGENLTVSGLDWPALVPGVVLSVGEAKLVVTKYCTPCYKIRESFLGGDITRISQEFHVGWSRLCARVTVGGRVRVTDPVSVEPGSI